MLAAFITLWAGAIAIILFLLQTIFKTLSALFGGLRMFAENFLAALAAFLLFVVALWFIDEGCVEAAAAEGTMRAVTLLGAGAMAAFLLWVCWGVISTELFDTTHGCVLSVIMLPYMLARLVLSFLMLILESVAEMLGEMAANGYQYFINVIQRNVYKM